MSNTHYVCFHCHTAVRRLKSHMAPAGHSVRCPHCGRHTLELSYKIPLPSKSKPKLWQALYQQLLAERWQRYQAAARCQTRRKHLLEKEIAALASKLAAGGLNPQHSKTLRATLRQKENELKNCS